MTLYKLFIISLLTSTVLACHNSKGLSEKDFSINITSSEKLHQNKAFNVSIKHKSTAPIDSVTYFFAQTKLQTALNDKPIPLSLEKPLGRRELSAKVYSNGKSITVTKGIVLHTNHSPTLFTYKIINTYPHDPLAFTQGLEFHNDTLYEGTGLNGVSKLRKVDLKTGNVLKEVKLARKYFGEGISILHDKIYQLTWRSGVGFIYDLKSFKKLGSFQYDQSKEGWGLCNDGKVFYKSDGTNKIWVLNPKTLKETRYIEPVTNKSLATKVNELEWVDGKIYANTWQKDGVLIINPQTGAVDGVIDFRGLKNKLGNKRKANVLNGIAYNKTNEKLYVTGKKWDKLFEVKIIKK